MTLNMPVWKQWVTELRSGKHRQCYRSYGQLDGGVCAVGLLLKINDLLYSAPFNYSAFEILGLDASSYSNFVLSLFDYNDWGHDFNECADFIENYMAQKMAEQVIEEAQPKKELVPA